jgi:hypothetical protein
VTAGSLAAGLVGSCGVLLVVAGAGKASAVARHRDGAEAIRRVLRLRRGQWRLLAVAAAAAECCAGAGACASLAAGADPVPACAAMAALGIAFCALLAWARLRRVPGGCGCLGWGPAPAVTARGIARAGMLACAGLLGLVMSPFPPNVLASSSFFPGLLAGGAVLALVSPELRPRTPRCRRPLWRPRAAAAAALAGSGVYRAMAEAAGPFTGMSHRRDGCADEFVFEPAGAGSRVLFRVSHGGNGLSVHARVLTGGAREASSVTQGSS